MPSSQGGRYDVVVIGSGFGGSVTALRLSEKGYRVAVLEAGRRWTDQDFASATLRDGFWAPRLGLFGPMRLSNLGQASLVTAVGVGGGSLIYANTLYEPHDAFYDDPTWSSITDWRSELAPYYEQARRMLGVTRNPVLWPADELLRRVASQLDVEDTFQPTDGGVLFDEERPGRTVPDPFFGGAGPERTACTHCARCTTGCPVGAKNTLPKNYLHLAEAAGAEVHERSEVVDVAPAPDEVHGRFIVTARDPGRRGRRTTFTADHVVLSAAARGTQELLLRLRANGSLPNISSRIGEFARSNSEAIVVASSQRPQGFDEGVTITSSFHPEPHTHVELCRSSSTQDRMSLVNLPLTDGGPARLPRLLGQVLRHPGRFARSRRTRHASRRAISLLVMQSLDNSLTSYLRRGRLRVRQGGGAPNPSWIPLAHDVVRRFARLIDGEPMNLISDLVGKPTTAHFIGGAIIGTDPSSGVVDPYHRLYGHEGIHVIDGSTIGANLGVNPSLTITAMAERAVALWPNLGDVDPRPPLGAGYVRLGPVRPASPAVGADAFGALGW